MRYLVTGGAGFIGSAVVRRLVSDGAEVLNVDKLTYAGNRRNVAICEGKSNYRFLCADIADADAVAQAFAEFRPDRVIHLAAESHVDRSIDGPAKFMHTNIMGTFALLQEAQRHWHKRAADCRFLLVSTDEVYGTLGPEGRFSETSRYAPNSPYSASKAAADHLAHAWYATYGLPVIISNCSNNYGPFQHAEKLIPTVIRAALSGQPIPIYGTGVNIRDWIFVEDHVEGLLEVLEKGRPGENYNLGGAAESTNLDLAGSICDLLDARAPKLAHSYRNQIAFVADRPGHDFRYAVDSKRAEEELGWRRQQSLASGLALTVDWYIENWSWLEAPSSGRQGLPIKIKASKRTVE